MESPWYHQQTKGIPKLRLNQYDNFFNATMTYRIDSTIPTFYRSMYQILNNPRFDHAEIITRDRGRGIVGLISNCRSKYRNSIVKSLSESLNNSFIVPGLIKSLEVYGRCGHIYNKKQKNQNRFKNTRFRTTDKVGKVSDAKVYKFYLALENSRCKDYITEKFMGNSFENGLVPIVSGPARSVYEKFAPGDSFIHVDDFESVEELANHLKYRMFKND